MRLAELTLLDFTIKADCEPPPPTLGGVSGDTLYVFAGPLGTDGYRGAPWGADADGDSEVIKITQLHYAQTSANIDGTDPGYDGIKVQMLGITREFHDPASSGSSWMGPAARSPCGSRSVGMASGRPSPASLRPPLSSTARWP